MASAVIRIGESRSLAPRMTSSRPNGTPSTLFEVLQVADHQDPVAGGDPEHGEEADERAEVDVADEQPRGEDAADERHRQRQEHQRREPDALERRLEQEQDRDRRAEAHQQQPVLGGLALGALAEQRDVVADRELDLREPRLDGGRRGADRLPLPATLALTSILFEPLIRVMSLGVVLTTRFATLPSRTWPPSGRVDQQVLDVAEVAARPRGCSSR